MSGPNQAVPITTVDTGTSLAAHQAPRFGFDHAQGLCNEDLTATNAPGVSESDWPGIRLWSHWRLCIWVPDPDFVTIDDQLCIF